MSEKIKKSKIVWSDDLSYDSEEENEKERLALAELANIETPEKPTYSEEEIEKLIDFIKWATVLCNLFKGDWNEDCVHIIKDFLTDPKCLVLFIFYHENTLKATLKVPEVAVYDATYFLRDVDVIFTVDNFHDEITFGTISEDIEGSLFNVIEYVYTPAFLSSINWPKDIKNEFCMKLYNFLLNLTDIRYKTSGLTVIYIPRDFLKLDVEYVSNDKELVKRLENVVAFWIQQIKTSLEDKMMTVAQNELLCPLDEFDFWIYRCENLRALEYQVQNLNVVHISNILKNTHSSYIIQFLKLCDELSENIKQAKSNIEYLQIMKEICTEMQNETDVENIPKYISTILNSFRFIWMASAYYNSKDKLTNLCKYLSNQVIIQCTVSIDLPSLFNGKTRTAISQFTKCIVCCKAYKKIYDDVYETHNSLIKESWNLDTEAIFNCIDAFTNRCVDMLEICNGMIIFGRIDEMEERNISRFGGTNSENKENICKNIELLFKEALLEVQKVEKEILDVGVSNWYKNMTKFRSTTKQIEALIENLISSSFKTINNIEEGIQILSATYTYSKRENLHNYFIKITANLWEIFANNIEGMKKDMVNYRGHFPGILSIHSGQAAMCYIRNNHLKYLNNKLTKAEWMLSCQNSAHIKVKYKELISAIDLNTTTLWKEWNSTLNENIDDGLNRKLICPSLTKNGLIESNFDRNILQYFNEVNEWININMDIPLNTCKIFISMSEIRQLYDSTLEIIIAYNSIQILLSTDEKMLFEPLICKSLKFINLGIKKVKWSAEDCSDFIKKCINQIEQFQQFLYHYRACNINVTNFLENICCNIMVVLPKFRTYELEDLISEIKSMWKISIDKVLMLYKKTVEYITVVYEGIEEYIDKIIKYWIVYVKTFDILLENALLLNIRLTLNNLHTKINGNSTVVPHPFLKFTTTLKDGEICVLPLPQDLYVTFANVLNTIVIIFENIPRIHEKFGIPNIGLRKFHLQISNDPICKEIQNNIIQEVNLAIKLILKHIESWEVLKHVWKISKTDFINDYISQMPTAREFDRDIMHYVDLANDIQMRDSQTRIKFVVLDNTTLKSTIIKYCIEWQHKFRDALKDSAKKDIDAIYTYIKHTDSSLQLPNILGELQESIDQYEKQCLEILQEENEF